MILSDQEIEIQMRAAHDWDTASDEQKEAWEAEIAQALSERQTARDAAQDAYERQIGKRPSGALRKPTRKI
jgi:hypothetical protein